MIYARSCEHLLTAAKCLKRPFHGGNTRVQIPSGTPNRLLTGKLRQQAKNELLERNLSNETARRITPAEGKSATEVLEQEERCGSHRKPHIC